MKYANRQGKKIEAEKGIKDAICPCCDTPVVAKCGTKKVHHWSHKTKKTCDNWWENETQWHRNWKSHFPKEWQEVVMFDNVTGEKHIADVRNAKGTVIELQNSSIKPEEVQSRNEFYKNIVWVVNAGEKGVMRNCIGVNDAINNKSNKIHVKIDYTINFDVNAKPMVLRSAAWGKYLMTSNGESWFDYVKAKKWGTEKFLPFEDVVFFENFHIDSNFGFFECENNCQYLIYYGVTFFISDIKRALLLSETALNQYVNDRALAKIDKLTRHGNNIARNDFDIDADYYYTNPCTTTAKDAVTAIKNQAAAFQLKKAQKNSFDYLLKPDMHTFIDNLRGVPDTHLYWHQKNKLVAKSDFINKYNS